MPAGRPGVPWPQAELDVLTANYGKMSEPDLLALLPGRTPGQLRSKAMRLQLHRPATGKALELRMGHRALAEARTVFVSTVRPADTAPAILVPGRDQRKLGARVEKGPWRGMPLYGLTLEERATCPHYCPQWKSCMGNTMHLAARIKHGPALERRLEDEFERLQETRPGGFVLRLHVLGDFYAPSYVARWREWLDRFPALHCFGYTAWHPEDSAIGRAVAELSRERWDRFAIRWSAPAPGPGRAMVLYGDPDVPPPAGTIVCPAQQGKTSGCGSCALCWSPAAYDKTIGFIAHGR